VLGRRSGDEKSFDTVFSTRLFRPVVPIEYRNNITRPDRSETLDGLERRFDDNPGEPGAEGTDVLPFNLNGNSYHLPVRFRLFSKRGEKGERRNFVAHGHALVVTSNGQVHSHWTPQDFRLRTKLNKLHERVFVVVESDELPIEIRTELFTADRAQLVRTSIAIRLEKEIAAFLDQWSALVDANNALIREAITGNNNDRPTIAIAEKIARALKIKGFSTSGPGTSGANAGSGSPKPPEPVPEDDLYEDPTHFEGPERIEAQVGHVKSAHFKLNAKDGFLGPNGRGQLQIITDHPDIGPDDITVGLLRSGRVRVAIAIPDSADLGMFQLYARLSDWTKTSGGLGPAFEWTAKIEVVAEKQTQSRAATSAGKDTGAQGNSDGPLVALIWKSSEDMDDWSAATVGEIEMVSGKELASQRDEYKDLAKITTEIPTIVLNRTYAPLKTYVQARAAELTTDEGKEQARDRYAVGIGVALLLLDQHSREEEKHGRIVDDTTITASAQAAARAVLSVLPDYDKLARELE
jgi:hypothetical protein